MPQIDLSADEVAGARRLPGEPAVSGPRHDDHRPAGPAARRPEPSSRSRSTEVWEDRPRLLGFFTTVDHKRVGMRYIYTSFAFFFVAGLLALVMRAQLSEANNDVVEPGPVQPAVHHARDDDDLPVQHPGAGRFRRTTSCP